MFPIPPPIAIPPALLPACRHLWWFIFFLRNQMYFHSALVMLAAPALDILQACLCWWHFLAAYFSCTSTFAPPLPDLAVCLVAALRSFHTALCRSAENQYVIRFWRGSIPLKLVRSLEKYMPKCAACAAVWIAIIYWVGSCFKIHHLSFFSLGI